MPPQSTSSWMQPHSVAFMSYDQASCWFKILLQAREWVSRVGEEPSMLKTRICLLESLVHEGLVLDCWQAHCIPLFHMQPWCATLCFMDLHDLASLLLSRCMQSQHPSVLPFHDNGLCPSSFLSSSLCSPFHSWGSVHFMPQLVFFFFYIFQFIFPLSCQELLLSPLQTYVHLSLPPHSRVPSALPSVGFHVISSCQTTLFLSSCLSPGQGTLQVACHAGAR